MERYESEEALTVRTIEECALAHPSSPYFDVAEAHTESQWEQIWHFIKHFDFSRVLELGPGHGRNTEKLLPHCGEIHLVDVNASCIDECRERFSGYQGACGLQYHTNDGRSLPEIPSDYVTVIYSWDSMMHFDRRVVRDYVREFARVLAPGGTGFVHH